MPEYSYHCERCNHTFSTFTSIQNYKPKQSCPKCKKQANRDICADGPPAGAVKLADSEIKTLGHLASRHSEKFSDDYKAHLYRKNNAYKENKQGDGVPIKKGMRRAIKKKSKYWS